MKREECTWWVNHLFNIAKESEWNKGHVEDAKEIETAQQMAIKALQQTAWIPVGERLPLKRQEVIVSVTNEYETYSDTDTWTGECFWLYADEVTAWMPLPELYREDGEEE